MRALDNLAKRPSDYSRIRTDSGNGLPPAFQQTQSQSQTQSTAANLNSRIPVGGSLQASTTSSFSRKRQTTALLWKGALRLVGTLAFTGATGGTLAAYEGKGNFSPYDKKTFRVITTALSLGLSLNFFVRRSLLF